MNNRLVEALILVTPYAQEASRERGKEESGGEKSFGIRRQRRVVPGSNFPDPTRPTRVWTRPAPTRLQEPII